MKLGTAVRGNGRDLHFSKDPNVSGFSWSEYSIELGKIYYKVVRSFTWGKNQSRGIYLYYSKFQYEVSSAFENLFPQFYEYLFTSSNITISYEAYSCTITNKSFLSLSLSTLDKHPDRCELL
ncbi:hypothetical protein V1477_005749 [Vespula maculifrons]|uniref:Uncharacterized protein n=1 Tax=Vespula maculifrons TaxID=7453 RepID=A0ABD2CLX1_VESMC